MVDESINRSGRPFFFRLLCDNTWLHSSVSLQPFREMSRQLRANRHASRRSFSPPLTVVTSQALRDIHCLETFDDLDGTGISTRNAMMASSRPPTDATGRAGRNIKFENDYDDHDGAGSSREPTRPVRAASVVAPGDTGGSDWEAEEDDYESDDSVVDKTFTLPPRSGSGAHDLSESSDSDTDLEDDMGYIRVHDTSVASVASVASVDPVVPVDNSASNVLNQPWVRHAEVNAPGTASFVWKAEPTCTRHGAFVIQSGVQLLHLDSNSTPRSIFDEFFTMDLWQTMVEETNLFAFQTLTTQPPKQVTWKDVDVSEVQKYVALRIYMGYHVLPRFKDYWAADPFEGGALLPSLVMSRDRFQQIRTYLHFSDNQDPKAKEDTAWKIRPVIDTLLERFQAMYVPSQKVCIDESLFKYRGRHRSLQFIPDKRSRYGLKCFKLCESDGHCTGYTHTFSVYLEGKKKDNKKKRELDIGCKTVIKIMLESKLLDKNYTVFMDNWYSSPRLYHLLQARQTAAVGTLNPTRKNTPKLQVKESGDIDYRTSPLGMMCLAWMDGKKKVTILSTIHRGPSTKVVPGRKPDTTKTKPVVVLDYNRGKTGVDVSDQLASYYSTRRKCVKWYQTLFCHLLDTAVVNAYLVHRQLGGTRSSLRFRRDLCKSLCSLDQPDLQHRARKRSAEVEHVLVNTAKPRRCKLCWMQCKIRRENKFMCAQCDVGLCPGRCFNKYHDITSMTDDL